ncbi:MAG: hypothetical protein ABI999_17605 [Acidobacteriota bacterium]
MAGKNWKGWAWDPKHGFTFGEMWHLLLQANTLDTSSEFSNTLLIGLFWEESTFQNWWQLNDQGQPLKQFASGFGQIERNTLNIMNALYKEKRFKYVPELMVENSFMSVCASVDYLRYLRKAFKNSSKRQILKNYGGAGNGGSTNVDKKVDQWLACEGKLNSAGGNYTPEVLTDALNAAEPNHAPNVQYVLDASY